MNTYSEVVDWKSMNTYSKVIDWKSMNTYSEVIDWKSVSWNDVLRSTKGRSFRDPIVNENVRKEFNIYSLNDDIRQKRFEWIQNIKIVEENRIT